MIGSNIYCNSNPPLDYIREIDLARPYALYSFMLEQLAAVIGAGSCAFFDEERPRQSS
jgi:hypothetical protein